MKLSSPVIVSIVISLLCIPVHSAIIPKGISSLLTNSKVPTQNEVFTPGKKDTAKPTTSSDQRTADILTSDTTSTKKQDTKVSEAAFNIQNFNIGSLFQYQKDIIRGAKQINKTTIRITALEDFPDTFRDFLSDYDDDSTTAILLSSEVIKKNTLKKLGIKGISFKLPVINSKFIKTVNEPSFLPINTKPLFLFNLGEPIDIDPSNLTGSIPLDINGNYLIDDYNILIPISYMQNLKVSSVFLEEFLIDCKGKMLFYNNALTVDSPLLITMIKKQDVTSIESPFASKLSSMIFEILSKNWLQSAIKSIDLSLSTVCLLHKYFTEDNNSICVNLNGDGRSIGLAPTFDSSNKLNFNGIFDSKSSVTTLPKRSLEFMFSSALYPNTTDFYDSSTTTTDEDETHTGRFGSGLSFKIQDGGTELTPNENSFQNITKCLEEVEYEFAEQPLDGSIFGNKTSHIGVSSIHETSPVLLSRPRPLGYKQIIEEGEVFTFE